MSWLAICAVCATVAVGSAAWCCYAISAMYGTLAAHQEHLALLGGSRDRLARRLAAVEHELRAAGLMEPEL